MSNEFKNRIKLVSAHKDGYEISLEEKKILEEKRNANKKTYKGAECINIPELYLEEEDYQKIYENMVKPVIEANDTNKTVEGGESR